MRLVHQHGGWGPVTSRVMAMVHVAMFEAANSIDRKYQPYRAYLETQPGVSTDVAAASAAYHVLARIYPVRNSRMKQYFETYVSTLPDTVETQASILLGEHAAQKVYRMRRDDGSRDPSYAYRPNAEVGKYVPTTIPIYPHWRQVRPWLLKNSRQFLPAKPPALTSKAWAQSLNEVMRVGGVDSKTRTGDQTLIARFWTLYGPDTYNPLLLQMSKRRDESTVDRARNFALFHMAVADTYIALWEAKYRYHLWRPITAIRNADRDGNSETRVNPAWEPLNTTPMHPEYPCAHCAISSVTAATLKSIYGEEEGNLEMHNPGLPAFPRHYRALDQYVADVSNSRIWGGAHYRFSTVAGIRLGKEVAGYAVGNFLRRNNAN